MKGNTIKKNPLLYISIIILGLQAVFLIYTNLFCIPETMDNDSAKVFVHAMEMWKNRTAYIPGWSPMTTLELDCPLFLAVFFYGISHDIILSFAIANLILASFTAYIVYDIMRKMKIDLPVILLTIASFFIPYSFGQLLYYNMTFFAAGQYCVKALVPLVMIDLMAWEKEKKWLFVALSAIEFFLCLICSLSSGVFVFLTGLLPVILCFAWFEYLGSDSLKKCIFNGKTYICMAMTFASVLGVFISRRKGFIPAGADATLMDAEYIIDSIHNCISSYLQLLGAFPYEREKLVSLTVVACIFRIAVALFTVAAFIFIVKKTVKDMILYTKAEDPESTGRVNAFIRLNLTAVVLFDLFILWSTGYSGQPRYFIPVFYMILIMSGITLCDLLGFVKTMRKGYMVFSVSVSVGIIFATAVMSDIGVLRGKCWPGYLEDNRKLDGLMQVIDENEEKVVLFLNDTSTAEQLRVLEHDGEKLILTYKTSGDEGDPVGFVAEDYYTRVTESVSFDDPHLLIINEYTGNMEMLREFTDREYTELGRHHNFTVYKCD
ncbi:MAG: hypothetical protein K6F87_07260 [Lachnospiraceae bacterium]|nr:hypothetical protein [Lachnospiraceae bacterium]